MDYGICPRCQKPIYIFQNPVKMMLKVGAEHLREGLETPESLDLATVMIHQTCTAGGL